MLEYRLQYFCAAVPTAVFLCYSTDGSILIMCCSTDCSVLCAKIQTAVFSVFSTVCKEEG